jgi:hypothetical protein
MNSGYDFEASEEFEKKIMNVYSHKFQNLDSCQKIAPSVAGELVALQARLPPDCIGFIRCMQCDSSSDAFQLTVVAGHSYGSSDSLVAVKQVIRDLLDKTLSVSGQNKFSFNIVNADDFARSYTAERYSTDDTESIPIYYRLRRSNFSSV